MDFLDKRVGVICNELKKLKVKQVFPLTQWEYKEGNFIHPEDALTPEQHATTKLVYRDWLYERTGKKVGGKVDWTSVSPQEAQALSERMFDAANVPLSARNDYYREFNRYIYGLGN